MKDDSGGIGMNNFANFKDDGSVNSKQRLALLEDMYRQNLSDYKSHLENEAIAERDPAKRQQKQRAIEQELAIYEANLFNRFFPEILELQKKVKEEENMSKAKSIPQKPAEKKNDSKKEGEKSDKDKKTEEKNEDVKTPDSKDETTSSAPEQEIDSETKPKSKTQELLEKYDQELKDEGINFDKFKERDDFDLENLDDTEKQELSNTVFKGLKFSIDKSEANHNPGWLLIYLKTIYPTLAQILSPSTLYDLSQGIMDGYITKNYGLHYDDIPGKYQDLKHSEKYKGLPIDKKMVLAEGIVAREMSLGYVSKQTSAPHTLTYLLDSVPFDDIERKTEKQTDIDQTFNIAVTKPEQIKQKPEKPSIYYETAETRDIVPDEQFTEFGHFLLYSKRNHLTKFPVEQQISLFDQSIYKKPSSDIIKPEPSPEENTQMPSTDKYIESDKKED